MQITPARKWKVLKSGISRRWLTLWRQKVHLHFDQNRNTWTKEETSSPIFWRTKKYINFIFASLILYSFLCKISSTVRRVTKTLKRSDPNILLQKSIYQRWWYAIQSIAKNFNIPNGIYNFLIRPRYLWLSFYLIDINSQFLSKT